MGKTKMKNVKKILSLLLIPVRKFGVEWHENIISYHNAYNIFSRDDIHVYTPWVRYQMIVNQDTTFF